MVEINHLVIFAFKASTDASMFLMPMRFEWTLLSLNK